MKEGGKGEKEDGERGRGEKEEGKVKRKACTLVDHVCCCPGYSRESSSAS